MSKLTDSQQRRKDMLDQIEYVMDQHTCPATFIELVAEVLSTKADHLRSHWQDHLGGEIYDRWSQYLLNGEEVIEESFHKLPGQSNDSWSGGFADNH